MNDDLISIDTVEYSRNDSGTIAVVRTIVAERVMTKVTALSVCYSEASMLTSMKVIIMAFVDCMSLVVWSVTVCNEYW